MLTFHNPKTFVTWDVRAPGCMALQSIITAVLICSTTKSSIFRKAALPVLLYLSWICVQTASAFTLQLMLYLGFAVCGYVNVYHCFNLLCLHPLDDVDIRREMSKWKSSPRNPGLIQRIIFATGALWSFRGIGTDWEIKSLPRFSGNAIPSKGGFLVRQCVLIVFQYLFMDLITSQPQTPEMAEGWAQGKEWLWLPWNPHPVTAEDLVSRLLGTLMAWFIIGRMMLDIWYRTFSVIFVGLGISDVKQWPPMYGRYSDCFTLRRYFNKFWHQCLRLSMQGVATYITRTFLGLSPSLVESYLTMTLVFALSGHFHILLDYCLGMSSWRFSGGVLCFTLMVPGIMLEDLAQWIWRRFVPRSKETSAIRWCKKAIGYVWVFLWMAAITPVYNFPLQRIEHNPSYPIPWSVVKHMRQTA